MSAEITADELAERWASERLESHDWRGLLARAFIAQRREIDRLKAQTGAPSADATLLHQAIELVFQCARPALTNPAFRERLDLVLNAARESAGKGARIAELEVAVRLRAACLDCDESGTVPTFLFDVEGGKFPTGARKTCPACDGTKVHVWAHEALGVRT